MLRAVLYELGHCIEEWSHLTGVEIVNVLLAGVNELPAPTYKIRQPGGAEAFSLPALRHLDGWPRGKGI